MVPTQSHNLERYYLHEKGFFCCWSGLWANRANSGNTRSAPIVRSRASRGNAIMEQVKTAHYLYASIGCFVLGVLLYLAFRVVGLPNDVLAILSAILGIVWVVKVMRGPARVWQKVLLAAAGLVFAFLLLLGIIGAIQNV